MTRPYRTLILDFGGVLTSDLWESVRACARAAGLPDNTLVDLLHHDADIHQLFTDLELGRVGQVEFERHLAHAAGIKPDRLLTRMTATLQPDHSMLDTVAVLRRHDVRIGILSNSWGSGYFNPYTGYDLDRIADTIIISDQVGLRKPDPAIYQLTLARLGATPASSVYVDDVAGNLPPAADLGMTTIHHRASHATIKRLERLFTTEVEQMTAQRDGCL